LADVAPFLAAEPEAALVTRKNILKVFVPRTKMMYNSDVYLLKELITMATKVRKQIYIEPYQEMLLKRLTDETGLSEAEFIRQAIDFHTQLFQQPKPDLQAWDEEKTFITGLIEQGPVAGGRTWQREDLYER
jgi:hypothetical protein